MVSVLVALLAAAPPKSLTGHVGVLVDGMAYVTGGMGIVNEGRFFGELWKVDLARGVWTGLKGPKTARGMAAMARLGDRLVLAGGLEWGDKTLDSAEAYDLKSGRWSPMPPLREARSRFAMVECNGRLYAFGGLGSKGNLASIECYEPVKRAWQTVGHLNTARHGLSAVVLDGKVLVAGGYADDMTAVAEFFDPATGRTIPAPPLSSPRGFFALVPVSGGCLAIGGRQGDAGASRYDNARRTWKPVPGADIDRNRFVALTQGHTLWVIGGEARKDPPLVASYHLP